MKTALLIRSCILVFCLSIGPRIVTASPGKPCPGFLLKHIIFSRMVADTTLPAKAAETTGAKTKDDQKAANSKNDGLPEVVKVIPKARRQPVPVPVKVNVQPVRIITPKIIKPIIKPVIQIVH